MFNQTEKIASAEGRAYDVVRLKSTSHRLSYRQTQINSFVLDIAVSDSPGPAPLAGGTPRRSAAMRLLVALLGAQALGLAALTLFLVIQILTVRPDSYPSAIGIALLAAIAAAWLAAMAVGALRGAAWIRGGAVTAQVLTIAVAIGSFQGLIARPDIGWLLLAPAVLILVLLFTRSVFEATRHRG